MQLNSGHYKGFSMLITFYTDAYENITFFGEVALKLLTFMGHSGRVPGAIRANELSTVLVKLEQELEKNFTPITHTDPDEEAPISLKKRAIPLINLLKAADKKQCDVMWK